jgi:hypothetical protein
MGRCCRDRLRNGRRAVLNQRRRHLAARNGKRHLLAGTAQHHRGERVAQFHLAKAHAQSGQKLLLIEEHGGGGPRHVSAGDQPFDPGSVLGIATGKKQPIPSGRETSWVVMGLPGVNTGNCLKQSLHRFGIKLDRGQHRCFHREDLPPVGILTANEPGLQGPMF